jgi:hypothetical protein
VNAGRSCRGSDASFTARSSPLIRPVDDPADQPVDNPCQRHAGEEELAPTVIGAQPEPLLPPHLWRSAKIDGPAGASWRVARESAGMPVCRHPWRFAKLGSPTGGSWRVARESADPAVGAQPELLLPSPLAIRQGRSINPEVQASRRNRRGLQPRTLLATRQKSWWSRHVLAGRQNRRAPAAEEERGCLGPRHPRSAKGCATQDANRRCRRCTPSRSASSPRAYDRRR